MKQFSFLLLFLFPSLFFFSATAASARTSANLTAAATSTCSAPTGTSFLTAAVDTNVGGATFTVSTNAGGNTISWFASGDGGTTWVAINATPSNGTTAATSTTSTGTWQANVSGYTNVCVEISTLVSGSNNVSIAVSAASARAGGSGGGSGNVTNQAAKAISANSSGTATAVDSTVGASPAGPGVFNVEYAPTTSTPVAPSIVQVGITPDQGAASAVTASDCAVGIIYNPAAALSLPTPTTLNNANCALTIINNGSASTITPATWTIALNGGTAGATAVAGSKQKCSLVIDQVASTQWDLDCVGIGTSAPSFPVTVSGTVNSGGIPCFTASTTESSSSALTANVLTKGGGAGVCPTNSSVTDNGTTVSTSEGLVTTSSVATGSSPPTCAVGSAGVHCMNEGTAPTGAASVDDIYANATNHCLDALNNNLEQGCLATMPAAPAAVALGSGTSISATSLCATTVCTAGTYEVNVYVDVTTACATTGGYIVWLGWTDDQGAKTGSSTTTFIPIQGTGATTSTGSLALASTSNYGQGSFTLRTTGAATSSLGSINYGTTASACGSGGPAVGKIYLTVTRLSTL